MDRALRGKDDEPTMKKSLIVQQDAPSLPVPEQAFREQRLDRISARAYEIYDARGGAWGQELDDWLQAERQIDDDEIAQLDRED